MSYNNSALDGDQSAKTLDKGANSALGHSDLSEGIHESTTQHGQPAGEKTTGAGTSAFDASGSIGKQFTTSGTIGGAAQKIGGPFDAQGSVGKHFTTGGSIGGSVQEHLGQGENNSIQK